MISAKPCRIVSTMMITPKCVYRECGNSPTSHPHLRFHSFPCDVRLQKWLKRCGKDSSLTWHPARKICSNHFNDSDYEGGKKGENNKLLDNAFPRNCPVLENVTCPTLVPIHSDTRVLTSSSSLPNFDTTDCSTPVASGTFSIVPRENIKMTNSKKPRLEGSCESTLKITNNSDLKPKTSSKQCSTVKEDLALITHKSHQKPVIDEHDTIGREIDEVFRKEKAELKNQAELDKKAIGKLKLELVAVEKNTPTTHDTVPCTNTKTKPTEVVDLIAELREKLDEQKFQLQNAELQNARLEIEKLRAEKALWDDGQTLSAETARGKELEKELNHAREMISVMKQSAKRKCIPEDQIFNLEQRTEQVKTVENQIAFVKQEQVKFPIEIGRVRSIEQDFFELNCETDIFQQNQTNSIPSRNHSSSNVNPMREKNVFHQRNEYDEVNNLTIGSTTSNKNFEDLVSKLHSKIIHVTRERDICKQQLVLYEKEKLKVRNSTARTEGIPVMIKSIGNNEHSANKLVKNLSAVSDPQVIGLLDECRMLRKEVDRLKDENKAASRLEKQTSNYRIDETDTVEDQITIVKMEENDLSTEIAENESIVIRDEISPLQHKTNSFSHINATSSSASLDNNSDFPTSGNSRTDGVAFHCSSPSNNNISAASCQGNEKVTSSMRPRLERSNESMLCSKKCSVLIPKIPKEPQRPEEEDLPLHTRVSHRIAAIRVAKRMKQEMETVFMRKKQKLMRQAELHQQTIRSLKSELRFAREGIKKTQHTLSSQKEEVSQMKKKMKEKMEASSRTVSEAEVKLQVKENELAEMKKLVNVLTNSNENQIKLVSSLQDKLNQLNAKKSG